VYREISNYDLKKKKTNKWHAQLICTFKTNRCTVFSPMVYPFKILLVQLKAIVMSTNYTSNVTGSILHFEHTKNISPCPTTYSCLKHVERNILKVAKEIIHATPKL
jgi:hypothetical protein